MPITPPLAPLTIGGLTLPNNLILAPMAGVTDGAFRVLCREQGVGFSVSELISAKGLAMRSRQTLAMLEFPREETPMAAQIFGSDPATMAEAARIVEERGVASVIDINMGCPVAKVVRGGAGAALLRDLPRAAAIIRSVRAAVRLPVTVKSRLGWDSTSIVVRDFVKMAVDSGAMAVAIHARTRAAMYTGTADWAALDGLQHLCGAIPFIANGDLQTRADLVAWRQR